MNIVSTLARLAATPQGRQMLRKAKVAAADPKNRARVEQLVGKVKDKAARSGPSPRVDGAGRMGGRSVAGAKPNGGPDAAPTGSGLPVVEGTVVSETVESAPGPGGRQPRA